MKKFFQKLKADYKFNKAGPGQKLSDNTRREPAQKPSQSQAGPSQRQSVASVKARNDAAQAAVDRAMKSKVCSEITALKFFIDSQLSISYSLKGKVQFDPLKRPLTGFQPFRYSRTFLRIQKDR